METNYLDFLQEVSTQIQQSRYRAARLVNRELLEVLNLDERIFDKSVVQNVKDFILKAGKGFAFIGNQHRLLVDDEEFLVDLLFYNRQLRCLVAVEMKKEKFKPAYAGQLNFYLKYTERPGTDARRKPGRWYCAVQGEK